MLARETKMARINKGRSFLFFGLVSLFFMPLVFCGDNFKVSIVEVGLVPPVLQDNVPFEINFKFKNTGDKAIAPFGEVTISGQAYDSRGNPVLRIIDKKYRVYNFWPDDTSGKQRFYIGSLKKGAYTIKLVINTYDRTKVSNICQDAFELPVEVK